MLSRFLVAGAYLFLVSSFSGCAGSQRREAGAVDTDSALSAEAWATVRGINRAWAVTRNLDSLGALLHPEMVGVYPGESERYEGREAILASYRSFLDAATVVRFEELRPRVRVFGAGQVAVVTYFYDMVYEQGGRQIPTAGQDMYTLVREDGRWLAVAQQFQPLPGRER